MANSNKHVNEPLRRKYLDDNPECELCPVLRRGGAVVVHFGETGPSGRVAKVGPRNNVATEVDHIFGGNPRYDLWSNFMAVCRPCHDWKHSFPSMGRVVELYVKWGKVEFDADELRKCVGSDVFAWLERQDFEGACEASFAKWLNGLRDRVLQGAGK